MRVSLGYFLLSGLVLHCAVQLVIFFFSVPVREVVGRLVSGMQVVLRPPLVPTRGRDGIGRGID